jgi:hypothetical protein
LPNVLAKILQNSRFKARARHGLNGKVFIPRDLQSCHGGEAGDEAGVQDAVDEEVALAQVPLELQERLQQRVLQHVAQPKARSRNQGCQILKNPNFGKFWKASERKILVYCYSPVVFYDNLVYILYNKLIYILVIWYILTRFGMLFNENLTTMPQTIMLCEPVSPSNF